MGLQMDGSGGTMNWDQNKELVEQILRTGMYAKLYDEETTYGYLTYLTYRVEDALFTWKKESDVEMCIRDRASRQIQNKNGALV